MFTVKRTAVAESKQCKSIVDRFHFFLFAGLRISNQAANKVDKCKSAMSPSGEFKRMQRPILAT